MGINRMQIIKNRRLRMIKGFVLVTLSLFLMACSSSRKEELNKNLELGEQLLQEENFDEAHTHYVNLLEEYQDNLTIMEKIDYSEVMKESRRNLSMAKKAIEDKDYQKTVTYLKKIPDEDEKAIKEKEEVLKKIKESFLERATQYESDQSFDIALGVLEEYEEILGEDPDITQKVERILLEKEKPQEIPKKIIVIDVAHQENPNLDQEPIAPNSYVMRSKVSPGVVGIETKIPEYVLNLDIAKEIEGILVDGGYGVYLTRQIHDVNVGNIQRSAFANEKNADLFIRLHGNSSKDKNKQGIQIFYPSKENSYVGNLSVDSEKLSLKIYDEVIKITDVEGEGVMAADNMPEHNFSKSPVITLLYGYMTNRDEDQRLQTKEYQKKIALGVKTGIDDYFKELEE